MKMNQFILTVTASLAISTVSFASYSPFELSDFEGCTKSSPCYWDGGKLQHADVSDDPWNNYTITTFTVTLGMALFYPFVLRAVDSGVDYVAYKFSGFSGLRDGGGTAQKKELEGIKRSLINNNGEGIFSGIGNSIEAINTILDESLLTNDGEGIFLTKQEQKDALKRISDAVTNAGQDSVAALNEGVEETKKITRV